MDGLIASLGLALRREIRRTLIGLAAGVAGAVLLLVAALGLVVAGILRIGDVLAQLYGKLFDSSLLGDAAAGLTLLAVPLIALAIVCWSMRRR
jgi:hypothetical protein